MSLHTDLLNGKIELQIARRIFSDDYILRAYDKAREQDIPIKEIINVCYATCFHSEDTPAELKLMTERWAQKKAMKAKIIAEALLPVEAEQRK